MMLGLVFGVAIAAANPSIEGVWELDGGGEAVKMRVSHEVDGVRVSIPFGGGLVRNILRRATSPCDLVEIRSLGLEMIVRCDNQTPARGPVDGSPVTFRGRDGRKLTLSLEQPHATELRQAFEDGHGVRTNHYLATATGELEVQVTITSNVLKEPFHYGLTYRRAR